jgi:hypothetical protein
MMMGQRATAFHISEPAIHLGKRSRGLFLYSSLASVAQIAARVVLFW